jgi:CheY-like chemotaxis protein
MTMSRADGVILVVEDSAEDYEATVRALGRASLTAPIVRCVDGDDALDWLYRQGDYAGKQLPPPLLILLDLNLPGTDGREALTAIKADAELSHIPVVVLTTSSNPRDVADCYRAGANTYIIKPVNLPLFYEAVACLVQYWLQVAALPGRNSARCLRGEEA